MFNIKNISIWKNNIIEYAIISICVQEKNNKVLLIKREIYLISNFIIKIFISIDNTDLDFKI